ncbi:hypothetical protein ANN_08970 [Periplaneta americana]|uniref:Uncharacterized protein n=1 Tax=Periplaneta americana TaxID=6978 RepID=A0ABQ8T431_PERAM|nr:hypothetical protein ANN_08970 [Periplaneta americana]
MENSRTLNDLKELEVIELGTFRRLHRLRTMKNGLKEHALRVAYARRYLVRVKLVFYDLYEAHGELLSVKLTVAKTEFTEFVSGKENAIIFMKHTIHYTLLEDFECNSGQDALLHKNAHFLNATKIRNLLRNREFDIWCRHPQKGKGVVLFKQYPGANKWICKHEGLSNSEWRDGIKMVGNVAAVRSVPGRSQDNRYADYNTFEEVHGLSVTDSTRRIDIIAFKESTRSGFIIDPTVRFETNEEQPAEVDKEKKNIYNPTIPYYQLEELEVIGLLIGARGAAERTGMASCKIFRRQSNRVLSNDRLSMLFLDLCNCGKPRKKHSQVGRSGNLNGGSPECESRAERMDHLARSDVKHKIKS